MSVVAFFISFPPNWIAMKLKSNVVRCAHVWKPKMRCISSICNSNSNNNINRKPIRNSKYWIKKPLIYKSMISNLLSMLNVLKMINVCVCAWIEDSNVCRMWYGIEWKQKKRKMKHWPLHGIARAQAKQQLMVKYAQVERKIKCV